MPGAWVGPGLGRVLGPCPQARPIHDVCVYSRVCSRARHCMPASLSLVPSKAERACHDCYGLGYLASPSDAGVAQREGPVVLCSGPPSAGGAHMPCRRAGCGRAARTHVAMHRPAPPAAPCKLRHGTSQHATHN